MIEQGRGRTLERGGALLERIAYMINPAWMAWSPVPLPAWLRWTEAALAPVGAALLVWTFRALGPNLTDTVVTRRSHTLVTRGPYRFIRHPLYDAAAVLAVAMSLMMANWFTLVTGASAVVLLAVRSRTEEDKLLARFGDSYRAYCSQTGRFVPRIARGRGDDIEDAFGTAQCPRRHTVSVMPRRLGPYETDGEPGQEGGGHARAWRRQILGDYTGVT
jgi:protein-S-isoprenylcysteine O-methyltransferase Ste14